MAEDFGTIHQMVSCPYDRSHQVGASRLASHLVKCRKQNPDLAKEIQICEYNQLHHIPAVKMVEHLKECRNYQHYRNQLIMSSMSAQFPSRSSESPSLTLALSQNNSVNQVAFSKIGRGRGRGRKLDDPQPAEPQHHPAQQSNSSRREDPLLGDW